MKVAIWGSYGYGNYGDDLMAIQFARTLSDLGTTPLVFCLDRELAETYGIQTTASVHELFHGATFAIYGGGPIISAGPKGTGKLVEAYLSRKRKEYEDFHTALVAAKCPLYLLSVGTNGTPGTAPKAAPFREAILASGLCKSATVRLERDLDAFITGYGIPSRYIPDVNLNVGAFWPVKASGRHPRARAHVGVNLPASYFHLLPMLRIAGAASRIQYTFIQTLRPAPGREVYMSELLPAHGGPFFARHQYRDPAEMLSLLASMDLVVSHKLHLGVSAVAMGIPFLSVGKSAKNVGFFDSIRAPGACWSQSEERMKRLALLWLIMSKRRIGRFAEMFDFALVERQKTLSREHLSRLREIVASHGG